MMLSQRGFLQARNQYRHTDLAARIDSATPHALVALMYERLIETFAVLQGSNQSQRATAILIALQASLDMEKGGALAANLAQIYQAMSARLSRAIVEQDAPLLDELTSGLSAISDAWNQLAKDLARV
jgi:flagellar secretion chaperone FliS